MKRYATLTLCSWLLLGGLMACALKHAEMPIRSQSGYVLSLETKPDVIWLSPPSSNQPNNYLGLVGVIVHVRDANGQPVEGVPVAFTVDPSSAHHLKLWPEPEPVTAPDGRARAVFEPSYLGTFQIHVRVDDVTLTATFRVEFQVEGNSTPDPSRVGLQFPF